MTPEVSVLTLRDLEYIIAIGEHRNFRLAAKACAVSQPALSGQIKKIEQALDIQLFERTNREVLVTSVGNEIIQQCRVILEELETLGSIARGADKPLAGPFRLGISASACSSLMPKVIKPIAAKYPALELVLRENSRGELLESLRTGKLDAVITTIPFSASSGKFHVEPLYGEPLVLAIGKDNFLYSKKRIQKQHLSADKLVFLDEKHSLTIDTFEWLEPKLKESPLQPVFTTSIESMLVMVSSTERAALVPLLAAEHCSYITEIEFREISGSKIQRSLGLVWRPRYRGAKALTAFAELLRRTIRKLHPKLTILS